MVALLRRVVQMKALASDLEPIVGITVVEDHWWQASLVRDGQWALLVDPPSVLDLVGNCQCVAFGYDCPMRQDTIEHHGVRSRNTIAGTDLHRT